MTTMLGRVASLTVVLALVGAACSDGGERPTLTDATVAPEVAVLGAVEEAPPITTTTVAVEISASSLVASSTTSSVSTTTTEPDDGPPPAPAGVTCGPGASPEQVTLSFDAASEDDEVIAYRVYVDGGDGRFVQRVNVGVADVTVTDGRVQVAVAPVPEVTPVRLAVTAFDEAGNESGWNPVDAWFAAGGSCNSGAPSAIAAVSIERGAAAGEVVATFAPPSDDVERYDAVVTQAGGADHDVVFVESSGGGVILVVDNIDYDVAFSLEITAIDHHGNVSAPTTASCGALSEGGSC